VTCTPVSTECRCSCIPYCKRTCAKGCSNWRTARCSLPRRMAIIVFTCFTPAQSCQVAWCFHTEIHCLCHVVSWSCFHFWSHLASSSVRRLQPNGDMASVALCLCMRGGWLGFCLFSRVDLLGAWFGVSLLRSEDQNRGGRTFHSKPCLRLKGGGASLYCVVGVVVRKSLWSWGGRVG